MNIPITIIQQTDGLAYGGTLQIGDRKFEWSIKFGAHISDILSGKATTTREAVMRVFRFTLTMGKQEIQITEDVFTFLMWTIAQCALDFYQKDETREFNSGSVKLLGIHSPDTAPACESETAYNVTDKEIPRELLAA